MSEPENKTVVEISTSSFFSDGCECLRISHKDQPVSIELSIHVDGTKGNLWMTNERDPGNQMPGAILLLNQSQLLQIYEYLTKVPGA